MSIVLDVTGRVRPGEPAPGSQQRQAPADAGDEPVAHHDVIDDAISQATQAVGRGALIVVPTDTVYGIGADAFDAGAVAELLAAKGRGRESPPPVLVPAQRTLDGLATQVPTYARRLVERFWPGPLTLVLRAQASLRWDLGDTNGTVAVRMPDDPITLRLLERTGPLAVSSANRHGEPAATTVEQAHEQLGESVEVYLDAGPSAGGAASTIVDCTKDEPVILRHGAVSEADVLSVVNGEGTVESATEPRDEPASSDGAVDGTAPTASGDSAGAGPDTARSS